MGPGDLSEALCGLQLPFDPRVICGMESLDDAGVYRLRDDLALIQTIDYFTPIVDDPYAFGQIAVANALSDVYTMAGRPLTALNIVCFPLKLLDISYLREILKGGLDKMAEAEVILLGGHTVEDAELKYGLAVTGIVHPDQLLMNSGARAGDKLILTKPLGTGIINTAHKAAMASDKAVRIVTESMSSLNRKASEIMCRYTAHACTDITGFGFIGHAANLARNSKVGFIIHAEQIPLFPEVTDYAKMGLCPGGLFRNKEFYSGILRFEKHIDTTIVDIFFDPQTSGGLLIALPEKQAEPLLDHLHREGIPDAALIGEIVEEHPGIIQIV